jgi:hypothetical protein
VKYLRCTAQSMAKRPMNKDSVVLKRATFEIYRALEFFTPDELTMQIGSGPPPEAAQRGFHSECIT